MATAIERWRWKGTVRIALMPVIGALRILAMAGRTVLPENLLAHCQLFVVILAFGH
jgi:hypothetical protein